MATQVIITIMRDDIFKSVRNITHKFGSVRDAGASPKAVSGLQADDAPQDTRLLTEAFGSSLRSVAMLADRYVTSYSFDGDGAHATLVLTMPSTWQTAHSGSVASDMKDYIVNLMVYEFLKISVPKDAEVYLQKSLICSRGMMERLNDRKSPL